MVMRRPSDSAIGACNRVGWLGLKHPDYVGVMNACFRIGAVLVAINVRLVTWEIAIQLDTSGTTGFPKGALLSRWPIAGAPAPLSRMAGWPGASVKNMALKTSRKR
jgi:acyl-CoA synthetase (AMP-forming)/AMP-acid ligase II